MLKKVTDPDVLNKLNSLNSSQDNQTMGLVPVTNPDILSRLQNKYSDEIQLSVNNDIQETMSPTDVESWADWIAPSLELGTALTVVGPATARGAAAGAVFGPKGALAGGLIAGTAATSSVVFGSRFAGEVVEDYIEGREFNPDKALQAAVDSAQTEAIASTAFGIAFPVVGKTYKGAKNFLFGLKQGDEKIETVSEIQRKLKDYDVPLLPAMADVNSKTASLLTSVAAVSQLTKDTVERYLKGYNTYMGNQISQILGEFSSRGPTAQGKVLQSLAQQSEAAIQEIVTPIYKVIDAKGKNVTLNIRGKAQAFAKEITRDGRRQRKTKDGKLRNVFQAPAGLARDVEFLKGLPKDLTFTEAHKRISNLKTTLFNLQNKTGKVAVSAEEKNRIPVLQQTIKLLEEGMTEAAERLSPTLAKQYKDVTDFYSKSRKVVENSFIQQAVKTLKPAQIGKIIASPDSGGLGVDAVRELMKLSKDLKATLPKGFDETKVTLDGLSVNPLQEVRKGFLEEILKVEARDEPIKSVAKLRKQLSSPRFKETFDALFEGTPAKNKLKVLFDEIEIFQRFDTLDTGLSLSVASGEIGTIRNPRTNNLIKNLIPSFAAKNAIKPEKIDKAINMIKAVNAAEKNGSVLSPKFNATLQQLLTGQKVGLGLGALAKEED